MPDVGAGTEDRPCHFTPGIGSRRRSFVLYSEHMRERDACVIAIPEVRITSLGLTVV